MLAPSVCGAVVPTDRVAPGPRRPVVSAVKPGLAIALVQVAFAVGVGLFAGSPRGYEALHHWDSLWYERIVVEGYHSPAVITPEDPGTAGFFPGYPVATRLVMAVTGLPARLALLLTAQLGCWGFWTYLLLMCRAGGLSPRGTAGVVLLLLLHPASFFLVAAYSESLFLMAVMGFLYWSSRPGRGAAALAAAHGFVMTATRLVGLPLVAVPLVLALTRVSWGRRGAAAEAVRRGAVPLLVAALSTLGALGYFLYCGAHLGHWDQYLRTQQIGWKVRTDYVYLFSGRFLTACRFGDREHLLHPCVLARLTVPVLVVAFVAAVAAEGWAALRGRVGWRERLPLYFCAAILFFVPASTTCRDVSMLRYSVPVVAVLLVAVGQLLSRWKPPRLPRWGRVAVGAGVVCLAALHLFLLARYLRGWWVA